MSCCPSGLELNAIVSPSEDQRGPAVPSAPIDVSCTALAPSGSDPQISGRPVRVEAKTTRRASGENCAPSSSHVDEIATTGTDGRATPAAGSCSCQTREFYARAARSEPGRRTLKRGAPFTGRSSVNLAVGEKLMNLKLLSTLGIVHGAVGGASGGAGG